jgi:hypothetical protein
MTLASSEIGAAANSMVNVESIATGETLLPPTLTVQHFDSVVQLANGAARGLGPGVIRWTFAYITVAQRKAFRDLCAGASASVYISSASLDDITTYNTYAATVVWPEQETRDNLLGSRNFVLEFRNLVLQGD